MKDLVFPDPRGPRTAKEFQERYLSNQWVEGTDLHALHHMPCPFCGAPDIIVMRAMHVAEDLQRGGKCAECGRGMRVELHDARHTVGFEVVQTEGMDPPDYIVPKPRRAGR